jgi:HK97 family phage major capsid protein
MEFNEQEKALLGEIENKVNAAKGATEAVKSELMKEIEALKSQLQNDEVKKEVIRLAGVIEAMKENPAKEEKLPTIKEVLKANIEKLKRLKDGDASAAFKAVGNMSITNNVTGEVPQAQRLSGLNDIASRIVRFLDFLTPASATSNKITWVYKANRDGATGQTSEGSAKNQIDFDLLVGTEDVVKTTNYIKVSDEMLDDVDFIESEIQNELRGELLRAVESGSYSGDGNGSNLNGVYNVATTFSAGTLAGTVDNANEVDVLVAAQNQIMIANQSMPNAIFMHPTDVTKLKLQKVSSSDKRYVERLSMIGGSLSMDGISIVPTTLVSDGTFLMGDFNKAYLFSKGGVQVEIGMDGDDFTKNMRTIRAEWRGAVVVKNNDRTAFVKGTFSTAKTALETA